MGSEWRTAPRVCRCCLSEGCYKDISAEYYWMGEKEMYSEMLRECFDLTITLQESSSSSRLICEVCITRLRDAANFKKQVITSEKRFAEHLRTGTSLAAITVNERPPSVQEIKLETVKTEAVISDDDDDDPAEPVDDYDDDPDYDESDSLPLKFEALKKETMVDISFGDEIPVLNNPEMTIKRVSSKTKEKSPSKKIKLSKKELTIKPVKASGSKTKVKAPKEPKVKAPKAAKTSKKGPIYEYIEKSILKKKEELKSKSVAKRLLTVPTKETPPKTRLLVRKPSSVMVLKVPSQKESKKDLVIKGNIVTILKHSNIVPFRTGISSLSCAYCGDFMTDPAALRAHTRDSHANPNYSSVFYNLKKDQLVKVDVTDLACIICSQRQDNLEALKTHLTQTHGHAINRDVSDGLMPFALVKDDWRCYLCSHRFLSFRSLNSHMGDHFHNYVCESCGRGFMLEMELQAHVRTHGIETDKPKPRKRKESPYLCLKCPERFRTHDARMKHMVDAHGHEPFAYKCLECPMTFKRRSARHIHMQQVHNCGNNFTCPHCPVMFVTKTRRDEHVAKHARDAQERAHECASCGKVYAQRKSLREHMKLHERDGQSAVLRQPLPPTDYAPGFLSSG